MKRKFADRFYFDTLDCPHLSSLRMGRLLTLAGLVAHQIRASHALNAPI